MKKVLFTRKLSFFDIIWSLLNGIIPIIKPMIKIAGLKITADDRLLIALGSINYYVFTSKNAVKYFLHYKFLNQKSVSLRGVEFIAIGHKTANRLKRFENNIHIYTHNDQQSFHSYVEQVTMGEKYLYFCSDLAAVNWKEQWNHENAHIIEIYKTIAIPKKVKTKNFKRLVFMSSSAVNNFFQKNSTLPNDAVCYAIGEPTYNTLIQHFKGKIVKPDAHSFQSIIKIIKS